ncbi:type II secretion system protein GspG [bacterium]|nr:MAG: type II secretion system protein GspG [bacterium]
MNSKSLSRIRRSRGFTLVELMVVVLIIAILAALVVPKLTNKAVEARIGAAKSELATAKSLLDSFNLNCGRYPTTEEGLEALTVAPSGLEGKWRGPYASKPIVNDPWENPYVYESSSNDSFTLQSYGADGAEGGEGDNADIVVNE